IWSQQLANELARVLCYPRVRAIHKLTDSEIDQFVADIKVIAEIVVLANEAPPVVPADPDDDYVVQTAAFGLAESICTRAQELIQAAVIAYCSERGIRVMNELELLTLLRQSEIRK